MSAGWRARHGARAGLPGTPPKSILPGSSSRCCCWAPPSAALDSRAACSDGSSHRLTARFDWLISMGAAPVEGVLGGWGGGWMGAARWGRLVVEWWWAWAWTSWVLEPLAAACRPRAPCQCCMLDRQARGQRRATCNAAAPAAMASSHGHPQRDTLELRGGRSARSSAHPPPPRAGGPDALQPRCRLCSAMWARASACPAAPWRPAAAAPPPGDTARGVRRGWLRWRVPGRLGAAAGRRGTGRGRQQLYPSCPGSGIL